jgi:hypothetical protein
MAEDLQEPRHTHTSEVNDAAMMWTDLLSYLFVKEILW